jgi:hypothetical protein
MNSDVETQLLVNGTSFILNKINATHKVMLPADVKLVSRKKADLVKYIFPGVLGSMVASVVHLQSQLLRKMK